MIAHCFSRQVLMVSKDKPNDWIQDCTSALTQASTLFSSPVKDKAFGLFDSSLYCDKMEDYDENGEEYKPYMGWMKNKDLIFNDCTSSLELIPEVILLCFISFTKRRFTRYYLNERKSMGRKRLIVKDIAVGILSRM